MTVLRQLLLLPLLAPLLAVLVVGALNPKPAVRLRLLTLTSPSLPIGVWMMLAATGGGLLSAGATGLALRAGNPGGTRRQVRLPLDAEPAWSEPAAWTSGNPRSADQRRAADETSAPQGRASGAAAPSRAPGEPPPTVEVPFRVIRKPTDQQPVGGPADDGWDDGDSDW
ncbi:MAG: hypothetical protein KFB97_06720 [Cyanobium sp. M30B3]|nr:MAG: hypothetical protein KFB97_06720 [Cyanobium sp. M30B3]